MRKHEHKTCPRCQSVFECRVGDITKCQCYGIQLNDAERDFLRNTYNDCLCADCLQAARTACHQAQAVLRVKQVARAR